jgi:hypothetical protein
MAIKPIQHKKRLFISYILGNRYTTLNQQNAQTCSFEVHIIIPHLTLLHISARKGPLTRNQTKEVQHNDQFGFMLYYFGLIPR